MIWLYRLVLLFVLPVGYTYTLKSKLLPYSVKNVEQNKFDEILHNDTIMTQGRLVGSYNGSDSSCFAKSYSSMETLDQTVEVSKEELLEVVDLLNSVLLQQNCWKLQHRFSLWQYTLCSNDSRSLLQQGHGNLKFRLGQSPSYTNTSDYSVQRDSSGILYLEETLSDGTICDLTQRPRIVKMQFYCRDFKPNPFSYDSMSFEIDEIQTCEYTATFGIPELCRSHILNPGLGEFAGNVIICPRESKVTERSVIDLLNSHSVSLVGNNTYVLNPYDNTTDMRLIMYDTADPVLSYPLENTLPLGDRFIAEFIYHLKSLIMSRFIVRPTGQPIEPGDEFLWRAPVVDLDGNILFLLDMEMSPTYVATARLNYNMTLLEDWSTDNMVYFKPVQFLPVSEQMKQTNETSVPLSSSKTVILTIDEYPLHDEVAEDDDKVAESFEEALLNAFADIDVDAYVVQVERHD